MIQLIICPEVRHTTNKDGSVTVKVSEARAVLKLRRGDKQLSIAFARDYPKYHPTGEFAGIHCDLLRDCPVREETVGDPATAEIWENTDDDEMVRSVVNELVKFLA